MWLPILKRFKKKEFVDPLLKYKVGRQKHRLALYFDDNHWERVSARDIVHTCNILHYTSAIKSLRGMWLDIVQKDEREVNQYWDKVRYSYYKYL